METTTNFHDGISKTSFPTADDIFDHAVPFDPANGMFNPHA
jgi:hypothetical protein